MVFGFLGSASAVPYYTADVIRFVDKQELASYEADFFLVSVVDPTKQLKIFDYTKEAGAVKTVTASGWTYLDEGFYFAFGVHTGGKNDPTADYFFFSNPQLNKYANGISVDSDLQHPKVDYSAGKVAINLEDQLAGGDKDFNDMVVVGFGLINQMNPAAPVPEPTTMVLFGTGLAGLAGVARRKKS
jgi:hypothetical protein